MQPVDGCVCQATFARRLRCRRAAIVITRTLDARTPFIVAATTSAVTAAYKSLPSKVSFSMAPSRKLVSKEMMINSVGCAVGVEGDAEGDADGDADGIALGLLDGAPDGIGVGAALGCGVGAGVGAALGCGVGAGVG